MSEYQYYEFRAIDGPLSHEEIEELEEISSRAEVTPTSFTNTYNYGNFRGDPYELMDRYFDAFVYVANWGTHRLMFRMPPGAMDDNAVGAYEFDNEDETCLSITATEEHTLIEFSSRDEGGDWEEGGENWMSSLLPIRDELMRGDLRALYVGWLASISFRILEEDHEDDEREPPVPPGLAKLSGPLKELVEFLRIDEDLLKVAAAASEGEAVAAPSRADMAKWVRSLPAAEKDDYLVKFLAEGGDVRLRAEITRRFREATSPRSGKDHVSESSRRTVTELLAARDALAADKKRKAAEEEAQRKALRDQEKARGRALRLETLAKREPEAWKKVEDLIATSNQEKYDLAVALLVDLREVAAQSGRTEEAEERIRELRARYSKRPSLIKRFDARKLGR